MVNLVKILSCVMPYVNVIYLLLSFSNLIHIGSRA